MRDPGSHALGAGPVRIRDRPTWLISRAYARAAELLRGGFEAHGSGMRSYHYRLLAALEQSGSTSQASLGRATGIDRSDVALALADLEGRGLIKRSVDRRDRRRNVVSITKAGVSELGVLDGLLDDIQQRLLAPLSAAERRQFVRLLHRLLDQE